MHSKEEKADSSTAAADAKAEVEENTEAHSEEEVKDEAPGSSDPESTKKKGNKT